MIEGDVGLPFPSVADHGIEDGEELPHASDMGDFGRLSSIAKPAIEHSDDGVPFRSAQAAHVESRPD